MVDFTDEGLVPGLEALSTSAGSRIYPAVLPQGVTLPAITYQTVDDVEGVTHDGATNLVEARYQLKFWADTVLASNALRKEVQAALNGYSGVFGARTIQMSRVVLGLKEQNEPETGLWWSLIDLQMMHPYSE